MLNIKEARLKRGLTQLQLAEKVGCSRATIATWERGKTEPHIRFIKPLAKALRCKMSDFFSSKVSV